MVGAGTITLFKNCTITGRILTTSGDINIGSSQATNPDVSIAPALNSLIKFTAFTAAGAIYNAGTSTLTGLVGTNNGIVTGFSAAATATPIMDTTAATDLAIFVTGLNNITTVPTAISPALSGTLTAGVYTVTGAALIANNLVLSGSATDVFIIKVSGKFTMATNATVTLSGGVLANNVFWQVQGDVLLQANTTLVGTVTGAGDITMFDNCTLYGRLLSTGGDISMSDLSVFKTITNTAAIKTATGLMADPTTINTSKKDKLSIYPNPVYEKVNLLFTGAKTEVLSTEVYDINQRKVFTAQGFVATFNLPALKPGEYIVLIHTKKKTFTQQFILLKK